MKQRIITGVILIIAVFTAILYLPVPWFASLALLVLISMGASEWSRLSGLNGLSRVAYVVLALVFAVSFYFVPALSGFVLLAAAVLWGINILVLAWYNPENDVAQDNSTYLRVAGLVILVSSWLALVLLHQQNRQLLVYIIVLIAIADSGAYFSGKRFGKHKLAPKLSPGKTWEGVIGGLLGASVWAFAASYYFSLDTRQTVWFIVLSVLVSLLSVIGDLFESLLKRKAGEKDSGKLLPGHGGVLDRVDGLIAALPVFVLGLSLSQGFSHLFQ